MAIQKPCPRCKTPLEIPQPAPDQIRCDKCGAIIKNRSASSAPSSAVTASPPAASNPAQSETQPANSEPRRPNALLLLGVAGGVLLLCVVPIAIFGMVWAFSGKNNEKKADPQITPPILTKVEDEKPKPPPPKLDPRLKIVEPAVDKGVAYLRKQVPNLDNMRRGYAGLVGLALLECKVPEDDPDILRIAESIRKEAPAMNQVYDLAPSLFFLNRWDENRPLDDEDRKMARSFALRIIAGQMDNGIWSYSGVVLMPEDEEKLLASLRNGSYKPTLAAQAQSMSNTQFAMLAVWGSKKHGVPIRAPLLALAAYFHENQEPDGSWNYPGLSLRATSTCAGLLALAIEAALLEDKTFTPSPAQLGKKSKKADIEKAFSFVGKNISRKKNDPDGGQPGFGGAYFNVDAIGDLYFLWTLERVGMIYSKEKINGKDWYDWGYPILLKEQQADGSWDEPHARRFGPLVDTPFALLFLKRANIARDLTEIILTRDGRAVGP